jgi:cell division protein FtsL
MNRKKKKSAADRKMTAVIFVCLGLFIAELFFYTWCRVQYTQAGYEITKTNKNRRELLTLQNNLKIELERLKSPDRIAKIAKKHLGLVAPAPEQMVTIQ